MASHIIREDILLIARIFPHPFRARKNITQHAKYPRVLYGKPSNKMYIQHRNFSSFQYDRILAVNKTGKTNI